MLKLSERQLFVLERAVRADNRDENRGCITTQRLGAYSISPATCKSLVKLGLLAETDYSNEFRITMDGRREYAQQTLGNSPPEPKSPEDKLARWKKSQGL